MLFSCTKYTEKEPADKNLIKLLSLTLNRVNSINKRMDDRSICGEQYAQKNFVAIGIPTLTPIILAINVKSTEATSKVTNLGVSTLN